MSDHESSPQSQSSEPIEVARALAEDPYEGAVPPGYDWPTHGGYLGCLLSLMASLLISGFLGSTLFNALRVYNIVPGVVAVFAALVVSLLVIVGLGRLGWLLGKRFYREYSKPQDKTWGEDDDYQYAKTEDANAEPTSDQEDEVSVGDPMLNDYLDDMLAEAKGDASAQTQRRAIPADDA